jgi:DNA ligase (NAD+)
VARLGLRAGDWVTVERGGDVIPKVTGVVIDAQHPRPADSREFHMPEHCPVCGGRAVRAEGEVNYFCVNVNCPARLRESLLHYASRGVMNIEGMGEALVDELLSLGLVRGIADVYKLTKTDLLFCPSVSKLTARLAKLSSRIGCVPLNRVLNLEPFTIPGVGKSKRDKKKKNKKTGKPEVLWHKFRTISRFYEASLNELQASDVLGEKQGKAIYGYLHHSDATDFWSELSGLPLDQQLRKLFEKRESLQAAHLLLATERSKGRTFDRVLFGLGIRHVGEQTATVLAEHFGTVHHLRDADIQKLQEVADIGPVVAESVFDFLHEPKNWQLISELEGLGLQFAMQRKRSSDRLGGKTFVLTGEMESFTRDEAKRLITERGGKVTGSVSSKTDFVVVGASPGSKLADAEKHGTRQINEDEFKQVLGL